jgi:hypothetical protein
MDSSQRSAAPNRKLRKFVGVALACGCCSISVRVNSGASSGSKVRLNSANPIELSISCAVARATRQDCGAS